MVLYIFCYDCNEKVKLYYNDGKIKMQICNKIDLPYSLELLKNKMHKNYSSNFKLWTKLKLKFNLFFIFI
jgi:hypothetical protein